MAEKRVKATNGKNKANNTKKNNDVKTDDIIKMVNENYEQKKWEAEQERKRKEKRTKKINQLKRIERKETIIILMLGVAILLLIAQFV